MNTSIQTILLESHGSWEFDPDKCEDCRKLVAKLEQQLQTLEREYDQAEYDRAYNAGFVAGVREERAKDELSHQKEEG